MVKRVKGIIGFTRVTGSLAKTSKRSKLRRLEGSEDGTVGGGDEEQQRVQEQKTNRK